MTKVEINGKTYRVERTKLPHEACDRCSFCDADRCPRADDDVDLLCNDYDIYERYSYFKRID